MKDNTRTAIGYICITFCFLGWISIFWALNLADMEMTINLNADNNTLDTMRSMEATMESVPQFENVVTVCNLLNDSTGYCGSVATNPDVVEIYGDCEYNFVFVGVSE